MAFRRDPNPLEAPAPPSLSHSFSPPPTQARRYFIQRAHAVFPNRGVGASGVSRLCVTMPPSQENGGGVAGGNRSTPPQHLLSRYPLQVRILTHPRTPSQDRRLDVQLRSQGWLPRVCHPQGRSEVFHVRPGTPALGVHGPALHPVRDPQLRLEQVPVLLHENYAHSSAGVSGQRPPNTPISGRLHFLCQVSQGGTSVAGTSGRDFDVPRPRSAPHQGSMGPPDPNPSPRVASRLGAGFVSCPSPQSAGRSPHGPRLFVSRGGVAPSPSRTRTGTVYGISPIPLPRMPHDTFLHSRAARLPVHRPHVEVPCCSHEAGSPGSSMVDAMGHVGPVTGDLAAPHHPDAPHGCVPGGVGGVAQSHSPRAGVLPPSPAAPPHHVEGAQSRSFFGREFSRRVSGAAGSVVGASWHASTPWSRAPPP